MRKPHLRLTLHCSTGVNNETAMQSYYIRRENQGFGVCFYVNLEVAGIGTKATFSKVGLVGKIPLQLSSQGFVYVLSLSIRMVGNQKPNKLCILQCCSNLLCMCQSFHLQQCPITQPLDGIEHQMHRVAPSIFKGWRQLMLLCTLF